VSGLERESRVSISGEQEEKKRVALRRSKNDHSVGKEGKRAQAIERSFTRYERKKKADQFDVWGGTQVKIVGHVSHALAEKKSEKKTARVLPWLWGGGRNQHQHRMN